MKLLVLSILSFVILISNKTQVEMGDRGAYSNVFIWESLEKRIKRF
jgi:hypothetical protein